ncbi:MAG TPA: nucleotidyltransferase family protein [Thermoleophilaceae bacterium]|nr:nucleotidyltransferase family protein [Thermoleophilaceae bacterium]
MIAGIVLAAGAGERFGGAKQLAELDGLPLLEHSLRAMSAAGLDRLVVVLGSQAEDVLGAVDMHGAEPVVCKRWAEGQSASLACGLAHFDGDTPEAVVVALGDQPRLSTEAVRRVLAARDGAPAARATYAGEPGHPVVLDASLLPALRDVTGDVGARALLRRAGTVEVPCDDLGGGADVDTRAQLADLREGERG